MHSGSNQDWNTKLYFQEGHPLFKINFRRAVLVASRLHGSHREHKVRGATKESASKDIKYVSNFFPIFPYFPFSKILNIFPIAGQGM